MTGQIVDIFTHFTGGALTPLMYGRTDHQAYFSGARIFQNLIPLKHGPAERRAGTRFMGAPKSEDYTPAMLTFEYSDDASQAYMIEAGFGYFRFWANDGDTVSQILGSSNQIYEISSPYQQAELDRLRYCQVGDVLFLTHPKHAPRRLSRYGHAEWRLTEEDLFDGPYMDENVTETTLTASAITGSITLTASATTGINDDKGFLSSDVGRHVRIKQAPGTDTDKDGNDDWGFAVISAVTSTTVVSATVKEDFDAEATTGSATWRLGLWSNTTGWPSDVTFHQERIWYASKTGNEAARLDGSTIGDYGKFTPGTNDDNAISAVIAGKRQSAIQWVASMRVLTVGTTGAEHPILSDGTGSTLTPSKISATPQTRYGSAAVPPVEVGSQVLFVQRHGKEVRAMRYEYTSDAYVAPDIALLAPHLTEGGLKGMVYQHAPNCSLWAWDNNGKLLGCTYLPEEEITAWHEQDLAGGTVENAAVIPGYGSDRLILLVKRTISGATRRYFEMLTDPLPLNGSQADAFYCDCGTTATGSNLTEVTGLNHLEGEKVQVIADGADVGKHTVEAGKIALTAPADKIHVGLPYTYTLQPMLVDAGARSGTAQGKRKIIGGVTIRLLRSLGGQIGRDMDHLESITPYRDPSTPMDEPMPLQTKDVQVDFPGDYDTTGDLLVTGSGPFPMTILAIIPRVTTADA